MALINRPWYIQQITPFIDKDVVKILTGIRRAGKSTILQLIQRQLLSGGVQPEQIVSINLEEFRNRAIRNIDALYETITKQRITGKKQYLFLDEIQEVPQWEQLIAGLQAEGNIDIYLTGSNAHFLSSEFATYISGRYVQIEVFPFSYREFLQAKYAEQLVQYESDHSGQSNNDENVALSDLANTRDFYEYATWGGFPVLSSIDYDPEASRNYLLGLYDTIVLKDMVEREQIRDAQALARLLPYLIANIGHTFSARSIEKMLKSEHVAISPNTILKYVQAACDAKLLYRAPRADALTKNSIKGEEKYYIADHGLREAVYGANQQNIDQVLENIIYIELVKHGWRVQVGQDAGKAGKPDNSGKTGNDTKVGHSAKEIDFIASQAERRIYIQVSYLLSSQSTIDREFAPLENLRVDYPKYVLSMDEINRGRNGIQHVNIPQFLFNSDTYL